MRMTQYMPVPSNTAANTLVSPESGPKFRCQPARPNRIKILIYNIFLEMERSFFRDANGCFPCRQGKATGLVSRRPFVGLDACFPQA